MRTLRCAAVRRAVLALVVSCVPAALAADPAGGRRPDWWPGGKAPPFLVLGAGEADDRRAILLGPASFLARRSPLAQADVAAGALPAALRGRAPAAGGWLIVKFAPDVPPARRTALLKKHGARDADYIPHDARLAHVPARAVAALAAESGVVFLGRFHPAYKVAPDLGADGAPGVDRGRAAAPGGPWRLDLRLAPGAKPAGVSALVRAAGGTVVAGGGDRLRVEVPDDATIVALADHDDVLFIGETPAYRLENDNARWVLQSFVAGEDSIHARGIRGGGRTVAVMDSGIDAAHCCFSDAGKIVDNRAWGGGVLGADCAQDHGTHVSGTVACANDGTRDGLAPDGKLILQDIGSPANCSAVYPPFPAAPAWTDARARGARLHTNSWGGGLNTYGDDAREMDDYTWQHQDFLILRSAGNRGDIIPGTLNDHATAKNVVTVGATGNGAAAIDRAAFSSVGPTADGRLKPDLVAPGDLVSSAQSGSGCGWVTFSGTSMATPATAGSAALVREYYERGFYPSGAANAADTFSPTAALVKATLILSARNLTGARTGGSRPNAYQGFGRVTLDDALWFSNESGSARLTVLDDRSATTGFVAQGDAATFTVTTTVAAPWKAVLVWTDPAASPSAARALVNDLDLEVVAPGGATYAGNRGFSNGWTTTPAAAGDRDRLNNVEAVLFESAAAGAYTVRVRAFALGDVAAHPQDYALVVVAGTGSTTCGPPPQGLGDSVRHARSGNDLLASWADTGADHYVVYRGTTPNFFTPGMTPYRNDVRDGDPATPGIQWRDVGAMLDKTTYFYVYGAADACGTIVL